MKEATETETGLAKRSCKRCKEEETKSIPTTDHVHKYTEVVTEPTCTEKGYTTHTCAYGDSYVDTYTNALGHDYEEKVFPPTCQNGGHSLFLCRRCGDAYMGNFTDPSEHSYVDTIVKPTCDAQGYTLHTCSACGNEYRDHYVESLGHDYGEWKVTKEATETETGEQVRTCKRCNKEQTEEIPVKIHVHQYTAVVTTEPTCEQPGITTYTCTSCGHKYIDYVPAALGHDYVAKVVKEATCDDLGEVLYTCSRCGDSYTEQLDPLDHVFGEEVVTPPTCEKKGYTTRTCINCGHQIKDNYTDALGHEFGEWETVTEPTEDSMGLMKRQCIRCEETQTKMIPALDHVHQYTDTVTAPTCTEKGYTTHTCKCGNSYVDTYTDALGHDYEDVVTEPTCTEKGSTTHTCKRCGYTCTDSETAALGHDYEDVVTEPTCGEQGYTTHTCKRCQDTYVDSYVDPTGAHDDGEWVVAKQPDVGVAGLKELRCTKCGYVLATEEIEMLTTDGVDSVYYIDVQDADGTLRKEMVVGHYNREEAQEMLNFVNEYRASINQSTLKMTSETMNDYVDMRAAETSYLWDHARPNGGRTSYSENIAQGNPDIKGETPSVERIFNAWLASEGHKANLDAPRDIYGLTGISVFYKKCPVYKDGKETGQYVYTAYWVEIFK
ncbi:ig domain protein group 2 domain protein [Clostridium sp. CAG:510]|nr:ig domain protein group 2 domain protein [Clostridium sp. CAG:510]